ncbi:hypothetical protein [Pseudomonas anguilliseptica]|uniref:ASCH domain-containing protein n=1 Tax=Pseudomonas anguilliseptica TaxID=53406 RepID=A0A1H5F1M0_PSEAG|nr:hypothetical protein [Pseudomonas anguilliseptica]SED97078.1 hypothetical protein SAMN05421553_3753 [Pseudomonas anguilliseptica]
MPTERPILFNDEMVRAILGGQKSVTRRVIKDQPDTTEERLRELGAWVEGLTLSQHLNQAWRAGFIPVDCPYDQRGDRLLVSDEILLEITDVRIERLQDISRGDAMAEGCPFPNLNGDAVGRTDPVGWFSALWESIYGAESWVANTWVWVVEFKRVTQ